MQKHLSANSKKIQNFRLSQKLGLIPIGLILVSSAIFSIWAYSNYQNILNPHKEEEATVIEQDPSVLYDDPEMNDYGLSNEPITPESQDSSLVSPPTSSPQPTAPQRPSTSQPSPDSSIPNEVTTIINSLESQGIKNNPNINLDTSSIPDGTTVRINRSSWSQNGNSGTVDGIINIFGQDRNGTLNFLKTDSRWVVSGYSLDS